MRKATVVLLVLILSTLVVGAQEPQVAGGTGMIAFVRTEPIEDGQADIYLIDASAQIVEEPTPRQIEAGVPIRITDDAISERNLTFSPDGRHIVYEGRAEADDTEIYIVDVETSEVTSITDDEVGQQNPTWSLDGSHIAYNTVTAAGIGIDVANVETGEIVTILEPQAEAFYPYWSAKESCDLYPEGIMDEAKGLPYVLNLEEGAVVGIGVNTGEGAMACAMEDRWLAYEDAGAVYVMNELTGEEIQVAGDDAREAYYPAWSPNGEWLAFSVYGEEGASVYVAMPGGETIKRVTTGEGLIDAMPAWQPYVLEEGASLAPEKGSVWTVEISPDKMVGEGCTQPFALCSFRAAIKPLEDGALEWTGQEMQPYRLEQVGPNTYEYSGRSVLDNGEAMLRVTFTGPETFEFEQELSFDAETDCLHTYTGTATFNWFSRE